VTSRSTGLRMFQHATELMVDSFSTSLSHFLSHYLVAYICRSYATGRTGVHSLPTDFTSYKSVNPDFKKKGSPILSLAQVPPNGFPRLLRIFTKMGPCHHRGDPVLKHRDGSKLSSWIHVSTINRLFFVPLVDAGGPFSFLPQMKNNQQSTH
jgi:hypothetical protein